MIDLLAPLVVKALLPKAPAWVAGLIVDAVPAIVDIVETLQETGLQGPEKFELAVREAAEAFDEALDDVPAWKDITEKRRDLIIGGLVELVVFIAVDAGGVKKPRKVRKDFRAIWRDAQAAAALKK
jgi:hypothetical protein